jgi:alanyl-tRNA synthetase
MSMVSQRLYYDSPALEFTAHVTDIRLHSRDASREAGDALWQVALDRTAFYPEGGGQPWDTGLLIATAKSGAVLEVPVERVEEDAAGEVWHYVRKPLVEGAEITGRVDAARRMDHAQQHSGQHLLSAIFLRELGAKTVGFRLSALKTGTETVTIDLSIDKLTHEQLAHVEAAANRVIYEDHALRPTWVMREEAEAMLAHGDLRKLPDREGPMRIVEMQGIEFNACGGTHTASTGAIGSILIRRLEKVKQGQRVEFCCGLRAVRAARRDFELLRQVGSTLSVGAADVPGRVMRLLEDKKTADKTVKALEKQVKAFELSQAQGS